MATDSPQLCTNGCGFFGSPHFRGMCSQCFKTVMKKEMEQSELPKPKEVKMNISNSSQPIEVEKIEIKINPNVEEKPMQADEKPTQVEGKPEEKKKSNRCHVCNKRVGLTGIVCRCGGMYCGLHRYVDTHGCTFDYKAAERERISKLNPVVLAGKITKL